MDAAISTIMLSEPELGIRCSDCEFQFRIPVPLRVWGTRRGSPFESILRAAGAQHQTGKCGALVRMEWFEVIDGVENTIETPPEGGHTEEQA